MNIKYIERFSTTEEYNMLSEAVGWGSKKESIIEEAFKNTLYSLCVYDEDKLNKEQKNHLTEIGLDEYTNFDYFIENDKELENKIYNNLSEV